jgi:hypothetical protein
MKSLLLTALAWISKVPGSTINEIFTTASEVVASADKTNTVSGWEKLKTSVDYILSVVPLADNQKAIGSIVVTIVVNVALLVLRLKGAK